MTTRPIKWKFWKFSAATNFTQPPPGSLRLAAQAGGNTAIDLDNRFQVVGLGFCHQGENFGHDKRAKLDEIVAHLDRQLIVFPRYSVDENRPKLAVVDQGVIEAARLITPES